MTGTAAMFVTFAALSAIPLGGRRIDHRRVTGGG